MSSLLRVPTIAILTTGTGPETLRLLVSNTPCHGVRLHFITKALAVWRLDAVVDRFLVRLRNDAGRIGLPTAGTCSFAALPAMSFSARQERHGRTDWGSTLLLGAGVGADSAAAVVGGVGNDSSHSQRAHRRGAYGSYGLSGYGAPTIGRGFNW
ncbi:hypothetical protein [Paracraurococcus lichenis]|uniref:Uncharacterized protein n=1 Tax=Paracraurococcus lichenis TaxID=3064888 RepID=A0ABT9EAU0_9PROT|nr:hypothetical protein [Paracraurococcus sp. LOR1-02]MDO9713247.1 hypothetical protein [Paracraurococcus sp. LOR1-02]